MEEKETQVNKITEDQLKSVTSKQGMITEMLSRVGFAEVQKMTLAIELYTLYKDMEEIKKELEKEYGPVNIDLKTGEYTKIEKEEEKEGGK